MLQERYVIQEVLLLSSAGTGWGWGYDTTWTFMMTSDVDNMHTCTWALLRSITYVLLYAHYMLWGQRVIYEACIITEQFILVIEFLWKRTDWFTTYNGHIFPCCFNTCRRQYSLNLFWDVIWELIRALPQRTSHWHTFSVYSLKADFWSHCACWKSLVISDLYTNSFNGNL